MAKSPTAAQVRTLCAIRDFQEVHRYPPTVRQLLALLHIKSTGNIVYHLRRMQELGLLAERASNRQCWRILIDLPQPKPDRPEDV
jgi:hypothetical protein